MKSVFCEYPDLFYIDEKQKCDVDRFDVANHIHDK